MLALNVSEKEQGRARRSYEMLSLPFGSPAAKTNLGSWPATLRPVFMKQVAFIVEAMNLFSYRPISSCR